MRLPAYAPGDMVADLAAGTANVVPWVGAGVGGESGRYSERF